MDTHRVVTEAEPLRKTFLEQIQQTRDTVVHLPSETRVDPAFLPTLDAIAIDLPSQVDAVTALAGLGDWNVVRTRLAKGMRLMETPDFSSGKEHRSGVHRRAHECDGKHEGRAAEDPYNSAADCDFYVFHCSLSRLGHNTTNR
jgi:hypothetical protein